MPNRFKTPLSILSAIISGVLLALCFEPWNLGWLVWLWQWPLLVALWYLPIQDNAIATVWQRVRRGWWLGYLCGFVFFTINSHWIYSTGRVSAFGSGSFLIGLAGLVSVLGMGLYLGIYVGIFGGVASTVGHLNLPLTTKGQSEQKLFGGMLFGPSLMVLKVAFINGACWVGLEWLRSVALSGYGWNSLGVALLDNLSLLQFADTIGQIGYGFVVMFCGIVGLATILRFYAEIKSQKIRPHLDFAAAIGLVIFLFLYGMNVISYPPEESVDLDIRINQLNVPIEDKYYGDEQVRAKQMNDYRERTRLFIDNKTPDIVMWPETALPTILSYQPTINYLNNHILKGEDFYLIAGIQDADVNNNIYNTLTIMKGHTDTMQLHNKVHLVPFGEFVPWRDKIPLIDRWFGGVIAQDFTPGDSYQPLSIEKEGQSIGVIPLICFEDTVGRHARRFVRDEPQFIANVTNDAWFYDSAQPTQHFAAARFRCIELRRPMVRCANSGVSGFVDEFGDIFDRESSTRETIDQRIIQDEQTGSTFIQGSLPGVLKINLNQPMTFYAKNGDLFSILLGLFSLGAFVFWLVRKRFAW